MASYLCKADNKALGNVYAERAVLAPHMRLVVEEVITEDCLIGKSRIGKINALDASKAFEKTVFEERSGAMGPVDPQ